MSSAKPLSLESLKVEINTLAEQVQRQNKVVADTGRRLISIEIEKERKSIDNLPAISLPEEFISPSSSSKSKSVSFAKEEHEDPATDENGDGNAYIRGDDIVELVTELQGQLDLLEARSIRRTANAFLTKDTDIIAPLPGTDGSIPGENFTPNDFEDDQAEENTQYYPTIPFPKTLKEFQELSVPDVETWCKFYELLPPDEAEIAELLSHAGTTLESLELSLASPSASNLPGKSVESKSTKNSQESQIDEEGKLLKDVGSGKLQDSYDNHQTGEDGKKSGDNGHSNSLEQPGNDKSETSQLTEEESNAHFDELARFLGLRIRRTKNVW